ncbi:MAG: SH3 domain-containing protein [Nostoc indistinguendum CM1-VF10]|jgi:hypothetical protein|nr:SH3 domain-containing protein [Nostoc indistinguendum CM1-VF10]
MNHIPVSTQFTRGLLSQGLTITAIAISLLASYSPMAQARFCRTIAKDRDGYVDVRSSPKVRFNNINTMLPNGTVLDVIGQQDNWLEIYTPDNKLGPNYETGWVAAEQSRRICSRYGRPHRYNQNYDDYRDYEPRRN